MKAMSLKPRDRYTTAHALSDDLENWLADRPVTVHRDSISTSLLRWARHHRTLVSTSAVILIAGLAGLSIITAVINDQKRQVEKAWSREQLARRVAERSLEDAQLERIRATQNLAVGLKVIDELVSLGDRQLFEGRPAAQRKKFLETASSFIRRFDDRSTSDLAMKARVARVGQQLANLERATGDYDKAETLYAESIALLDPLAEPEEAPAELRDQLAETLLDQGQTALERGHADAATQALLRARRLAQENNRRHPANLAYRRTLGRSLYLEGAALLATGDDQAATALRDAVATLASVADETLPTVRLQLSREQPLPFYDQSQAVAAMGQLGISLRQADAAAEALTVQRRAFERLQELGRILDGLALPDLELYRAWTQARLAETLLESQTDAVEPLERLNDAVNRLEKLVTAQPDIQRYHEYLADALILRARALDQEGKNEMARADVERARSLISPLLKTNPDLPDYQGLLAQAFLVEGDLARKPGGAGVAKARERYESALAAYEAALKVLPKNRDLLKGRDACRTRLAD